MNNDEHKYDDIINLDRHISKVHKQMSIRSRSAQFAPFAALTGYNEAVKETARLTNERIEIDEGLKSIIDNKLRLVKQNIKNKPLVVITYFITDIKKKGGSYKKVSGNVKKIDEEKNIIILLDNTRIPIKEIIDINYN